VAPRRWASPDEVLALAAERSEPALVLVLDSLEDPQNVGTLLRSAEATGVHGAIFPTHRQAPLTPAAVKASAGAVEHLRLAPVDDLAGALADLHARGLRIVGADGDAALTAREADLRGPIAIVVGSEGRGLGSAVRRRCDLLVRIPMHGRIESLNAAVAGSILLYEAAAQRRLPESEPHEPASDAGPHRAPEALDPADEQRDASGDPDARPAPLPETAGSIRRGSRRTVATTLAPEAVPSHGTSSDDVDELLPGEAAADLVEPATDLDSEPAGDTTQV
jgi:predicted rRNA methylase